MCDSNNEKVTEWESSTCVNDNIAFNWDRKLGVSVQTGTVWCHLKPYSLFCIFLKITTIVKLHVFISIKSNITRNIEFLVNYTNKHFDKPGLFPN